MRGVADEVAEEFTQRLCFGRPAEATMHLEWLIGEVRARVSASVTLSDGAAKCLAVSGLQAAARQMGDAYGADWGHADLLTRALGSVLASTDSSEGAPSVEAAAALTKALIAIGAGRPMVDAAACSGCRAVCVYGSLGMGLARRLAGMLGPRPSLKGSPPMPSVEQLTAAISQTVPWLDDVHLQPLTYCVSVWMRVGPQQRTK